MPATGPNVTIADERWQRIKAVFSAALTVEAASRDRILSELCGEDAALRAEVQELLRGHDSSGFVDALADSLARSSGSTVDKKTPGRIGRYEVLEKIGQGGMGVIYKARDERLDRIVAIKILSPGRYAEPAERRRLLTEARAVAALDHPCIATIFEADEADDTGVFLVMAFYEGETLAERIRRGPLSPSDASRIALQIADALAAAHARRITHRDLKPANVLLTRGGSIKLLDFGVAKIAGVDQTQIGQVLGTVEYMAPEQRQGASADPQVDVWALGIVLYEMLTGKRPPSPHTHASTADALSLMENGRPEVPHGLNRIIRRALSVQRQERYGDGAEMRDALAAWIQTAGAAQN
jgi:eukaryotic-like serine/threonine-protein kinase